VRRGLADSRERAQADIAAGRVLVAGAVASKARTRSRPTSRSSCSGRHPRFVGPGRREARGGAGPLRRRPGRTPLPGRRRVDGRLHRLPAAARRHRGGRRRRRLRQLHERLRSDARVRNLERTNIRDLAADDVGGPVDLLVADLSFISLTTVAPALVGLVRPPATSSRSSSRSSRRAAPRRRGGKGVIRSPTSWRRVLGEVADVVASGERP
jgi:23S rRNA (cytidine1920-2'-O)/16S rRNA (cytidine1409-2'-O)-methyltransferase